MYTGLYKTCKHFSALHIWSYPWHGIQYHFLNRQTVKWDKQDLIQGQNLAFVILLEVSMWSAWNQQWNSIAVYTPFLGLSCEQHFLRVCTEVLDVVAVSRPGIFNSCRFSLSCLLQLNPTYDGRWLVLGTLPLQCSNCQLTIITTTTKLGSTSSEK